MVSTLPRQLLVAALGALASAQSVVWTDLLPEPGIDTSSQAKTPTLTYHNSMPIGNGHIAVREPPTPLTIL